MTVYSIGHVLRCLASRDVCCTKKPQKKKKVKAWKEWRGPFSIPKSTQAKYPAPVSHLVSAIRLLVLFLSYKSIPGHSVVANWKKNEIKHFVHHLRIKAFSSRRTSRHDPLPSWDSLLCVNSPRMISLKNTLPACLPFSPVIFFFIRREKKHNKNNNNRQKTSQAPDVGWLLILLTARTLA